MPKVKMPSIPLAAPLGDSFGKMKSDTNRVQRELDGPSTSTNKIASTKPAAKPKAKAMRKSGRPGPSPMTKFKKWMAS